jgi:TetR/AcrR family transcriptional repressor of nem operon
MPGKSVMCYLRSPSWPSIGEPHGAILTGPQTTSHIFSMPKENVREKILTVGLDTVHRRGFNATGVQQIVDAAGVPKGSFYNYFDSKEAWGLEVLDLYFQGFGASLKVLDDRSKSPVERLRLYFESLGRTLEKWEFEKGCLVGNLSGELSDQSQVVRDRLASVYAGWVRRIESCVREGQDRGEIPRDLKASMIAAFLLHAWQGTVLRTKVDKDNTAVKQFLAVVFKKILN